MEYMLSVNLDAAHAPEFLEYKDILPELPDGIFGNERFVHRAAIPK